jgi:2'-5' RNA ligase
MEKRHRIFVAINLPADIRRELFLNSEKWPDFPAKWVEKDNLHITLEFLGALTDEEIGEVCVITKEVAERHAGFSLTLNQILYGPPNLKPGQAPKFVWVEGEKSEELSELREDLENSLTEKVRFVPESRIFAPHITLARISAWAWKGIEPEERPEINEKLDLLFSVESIEVMESELHRDGPRYAVLESYQLKE